MHTWHEKKRNKLKMLLFRVILTSEIICSGGLPERHLCVENGNLVKTARLI